LDSWPVPSGWFSEQGITCRRILSDNGPAPTALELGEKACRALDLKAHPHQALHAQTNTGRPNGSSKPSGGMGLRDRLPNTEWNATVATRYLGIYNAAGYATCSRVGLTPQQCPSGLLIAE